MSEHSREQSRGPKCTCELSAFLPARKARLDYAQGSYRFVATVVNKLLIAEPDNWPARHLLADAYDRLGYHCEGTQWRSAYRTAAKELRTGQVLVPQVNMAQSDLLAAATIPDILDSLAVRVNSQKAQGKNIRINLYLPDTDEQFSITLTNGNLSYFAAAMEDADLTLTLNRRDLMQLIGGQLSIPELVALGIDSIAGSPPDSASFLSVLEKDNRYYDMVPMPAD